MPLGPKRVHLAWSTQRIRGTHLYAAKIVCHVYREYNNNIYTQGHLQSCKFTDFVVCGHNGCKMRLPRARLHKHELQCKFRTIKCYKCHDQVAFYQLVVSARFVYINFVYI